MTEQPDRRHERPPDATDAEVAAVGKVSEAYEWVLRARGRLYDFHQMVGRADLVLGEAVDELRAAGHEELADRLASRWLGRNVLADRWSFEVVEDFDDTYLAGPSAGEREARDELVQGRRHVHEAELKADRPERGPTDDR